VTDEAKGTMLDILGRYGFSTLVAIALAWFIRTDLLQPLLEEHRLTLKEVREAQREIADAVNEQTRLLIAIQSGRPMPVRATVDTSDIVPGNN